MLQLSMSQLTMVVTLQDEQLDILQAWRTFMLRELALFKGKFRGAGATLLGAGDKTGFSLGQEPYICSARNAIDTAPCMMYRF